MKIAATVFSSETEFKQKTQGLCLYQRPENTAGGLDFEVQIEERPLKAVRLHSFIANKVYDFKANFAISC